MGKILSSNYKKVFWTLLLACFATFQLQAAIDPAIKISFDNPEYITRGGYAETFNIKIVNDGTRSYTNLTLKVTVPNANWTIVTSGGTDVSTEQKTIPLLDMGHEAITSVNIKAGCSALVNVDKLDFKLYNGEELIADMKSLDFISNVFTANRVQTYTAGTVACIPGQEYTRTWSVSQSMQGLHITPEGLSVNTYVNKIEVTKAFFVDKLGNELAQIPTSQMANYTSYIRYTFIKDDFRNYLQYVDGSGTSNGNERLDNKEILYVKEYYKLTSCSGGSSYFMFTSPCQSTTGNNTSQFAYSAVIPANGSVVTISNVLPLNLTTDGKAVFKFTNTGSVPLGSMNFEINTVDYYKANVDLLIKKVQYSKSDGTPDGSKPGLSFTNSCIYYPASFVNICKFIGNFVGFNDDVNGYLQPGDSIIFSIEYNYDFSKAQDCYSGGTGGFNPVIHSSQPGVIVIGTEPLCNNKKQYSVNFGTTTRMYGDATSFTLSKQTIYSGDQVTLTIQTNALVSDNSTLTWPLHVIMEIPKGFIFDKNDPKCTITTTTNPIITINKTDIETTTDPLTGRTTIRFKYPQTATRSNNYIFKVGLIAAAEDDMTNHIFNFKFETQYPGDDPVYFGCKSFSNTEYTFYETGACKYAEITSLDAERMSFGYKSETDLTRMNYEQAKAAGANLKVAGPYDNVRFKSVTRLVSDIELDNAEQFGMELTYYNNYFTFQGATIRFSSSGNSDADFGGVVQTIDAADITQPTITGGYMVRVNLTKYIGAGKIIPELKAGTYIEVAINGRLDGSMIPSSPTAISLKSEFYRSNRARQTNCAFSSNNFSVYDYGTFTANSSSAGAPTYSVGGDITGGRLISMKFSGNTGGQEVFVNEYRPNVSFSRTQYYYTHQTLEIDRIYDWRTSLPNNAYSTYFAADYTNGGRTGVTIPMNYFGSDLPLMSPEIYTTGGIYDILFDGKSICAGTRYPNYWIGDGADALSTLYIYSPYPTSEAPTTRSMMCRPSESSYNGANKGSAYIGNFVTPNYTVSVTNLTNQIPSSGEVSWKFTIRNISYASVGDLRNCYIALSTISPSSLEQIMVYDSGGNLVMGEDGEGMAPYSEQNDKFWIKLGSIGNGPNNDGYTYFTVKAKLKSCASISGNMYFGQGAKYPLDPESGDLKYGNQVCGRTAWNYSISIPAANQYTSSIQISSGSQIDGKYDFCDPVDVAVRIDNGSTTTTMKKIYAKVSTKGFSLVEGVAPKVRFKNVDYAVSYTVYSDYILFVFPDAVELETFSTLGGKFTTADLTFRLRMNCDLVSGRPVSVETGTTNGCSTAAQHVYSPGIFLFVDPTDLPVLKLKSLNLPADIYLKNDNDGKFVFTAYFDYLSNPKNNVYAAIELPDNLVMDGTATLELNGQLIDVFREDGSSNRLIAAFDKPLLENLEYKAIVPLKIVKPETWTCKQYTINTNCFIGIDYICPEADGEVELDCSVKSIIDQDNAYFNIHKYNVSIDENTVKMKESYDASSPTKQRLIIDGDIKNNDSEELPANTFHLYLVDDQSNVFSDIIVPAAIPAGGKYTFHGEANVPAEKICLVSLTTDTFACNRPLVKKQINYVLRDSSYMYGCETRGDMPIGDPLIFTGDKSYKYTWTPDTHLKNADTSQPYFFYGVEESTAGANQTQKMKLNVNRPNGCLSSANVQVYIIPKKTKWLGVDNNWNNTSNWDNGIPGYCTYAVIQKAKSKYPELTEAMKAECDTIEFEFGGEVAKTPLLAYNHAIVHLDVPPGKWYMMSAPLRNMYSGDYILSNNRRDPRVLMMQYQENNPDGLALYKAAEGKWSMPFSSLGEQLKLGHGYVLYVDLQNYPTASSISRNSFIFPQDTTSYKYHNSVTGAITSNPGVSGLVRNHSGRFIYEEYKVPTNGRLLGNEDLSIPVKKEYTLALVSNPFMSHLNFATLRTVNPGLLDSFYYMWSGTSFDIFGNGAGWNTQPGGSNSLIPPQQSFIVKRMNTTFTELKITPAMSVTNNGAKLRSDNPEEEDPFVNIELKRNDERQSAINIIYKQGTDNKYNSAKDAYTMFSSMLKAPAILYSPIEGKAASIRTIGDLTENIPLDIQTEEKGKLTFIAGDLSSFGTAGIGIYLLDMESSTMQDLYENPVYTFDNATGNISDRFFLHFNAASTGTEKVKVATVQVYTREDQIFIKSFGEEIQQVTVYDIQGKVLYSKDELKTASHSFRLTPGEQVVIVKVQTDSDVSMHKVLIKQSR